MDRFDLSTPIHTPITSSIFLIRALPVGMSPSNLAQSGKLPTSQSRRFTGRHKRVSSGRHALRHYDHRVGEPWNGWKDCWKDFVLRGKKEEEGKKAGILLALLADFAIMGFPTRRSPRTYCGFDYTIL
jgi:hypothetical protein